MKPIVTWVVLANTRFAKVFENHGPGKGLVPVNGQSWQAPQPDGPQDRAGVGHSIAGPGVSAVKQTDPQDLVNAQFARTVVAHLRKAHQDKRFDRLVLTAGPHMLGLMREHLDAELSAVLLGEMPKDLSHQPVATVETQLGKMIAV